MSNAPWPKYKWNRLDIFTLASKVNTVRKWDKQLPGQNNYAAALMEMGVIVESVYVGRISSTSALYGTRYYDVVNPITWEQDILALDARMRLEKPCEDIF